MKHILPDQAQHERIATALERMADPDSQKVTDHTGSPGPKVLMAGDRNYGFYGFVQPHEFGQISGNPDGNKDFDGANLALAIGLSQGTAQYENTAWMKFSDDGEIIFVPVRALRHTVSWNGIYDRGAVYGDDSIGLSPKHSRTGHMLSVNGSRNAFAIEDNDDNYFTRSGAVTAAVGDTLVARGFDSDENNGEFTVQSISDMEIVVDGDLVTEDGNKKASVHAKKNETKQNRTVTIGGHEFSVELLRGAANNPTDSYGDSDRGMVGSKSQWNNLILPLHEQAKTGNWTYKSYAGDVDDWGIGLTDLDLITHRDLGTGSYSWCQETRDTGPVRRVFRGYYGASIGNADLAWDRYSFRGWRPALRLLS